MEEAGVTPHLETQKRHFQKRLVLYIFGMSWGSVSFGYASAIIATTLGQKTCKA
jgi:hypothetical protein